MEFNFSKDRIRKYRDVVLKYYQLEYDSLYSDTEEKRKLLLNSLIDKLNNIDSYLTSSGDSLTRYEVTMFLGCIISSITKYPPTMPTSTHQDSNTDYITDETILKLTKAYVDLIKLEDYYIDVSNYNILYMPNHTLNAISSLMDRIQKYLLYTTPDPSSIDYRKESAEINLEGIKSESRLLIDYLHELGLESKVDSNHVANLLDSLYKLNSYAGKYVPPSMDMDKLRKFISTHIKGYNKLLAGTEQICGDNFKADIETLISKLETLNKNIANDNRIYLDDRQDVLDLIEEVTNYSVARSIENSKYNDIIYLTHIRYLILNTIENHLCRRLYVSYKDNNELSPDGLSILLQLERNIWGCLFYKDNLAIIDTEINKVLDSARSIESTLLRLS